MLIEIARRAAVAAARIAAATAISGVVATTMSAQPAKRLASFVYVFADQFSTITSVVAASDGAVFVSDAKEKMVKRITSSGSKQIGGQGAGPGEYTIPGRLAMLRADTLAVVDGRQGRVVFFDKAGKPAGVLTADQFPKSESLVMALSNPSGLIGGDAAGRLYFLLRNPSAPKTASAVVQNSLTILRVDRRAKTVTEIGRLRGEAARVTLGQSGGTATGISIVTNPLAVGEQAVIAPDGRLVMARLEPYRVSFRSAAGAVVNGPLLRHDKVPVSANLKAAAIEREDTRRGSAKARRVEEVADWPAALPPFTRNAAQLDARGRLWLERPAATSVLTSYDLIDRMGRLVMVVHTEGRLRLIGFAGQLVLMARVLEDGLQVVQVHPLP